MLCKRSLGLKVKRMLYSFVSEILWSVAFMTDHQAAKVCFYVYIAFVYMCITVWG